MDREDIIENIIGLILFGLGAWLFYIVIIKTVVEKEETMPRDPICVNGYVYEYSNGEYHKALKEVNETTYKTIKCE